MTETKSTSEDVKKPTGSTAETSQKSSLGGVCLTIAITALITFVLTTVAVGGGIYLWQKAVCVTEKDKLSSEKSSTNEDNDSLTTTDDDIPITTQDLTVEGTSPTDNVENFIVLTLGTVPGATLDYNKAKTYLSAAEKAKFTDDSYIPQFYGIQEGPDTYEMKTQTINGDYASVKVDVLYGEMMEAWAFTLIWEDSAWLIDGFRNDAQ